MSGEVHTTSKAIPRADSDRLASGRTVPAEGKKAVLGVTCRRPEEGTVPPDKAKIDKQSVYLGSMRSYIPKKIFQPVLQSMKVIRPKTLEPSKGARDSVKQALLLTQNTKNIEAKRVRVKSPMKKAAPSAETHKTQQRVLLKVDRPRVPLDQAIKQRLAEQKGLKALSDYAKQGEQTLSKEYAENTHKPNTRAPKAHLHTKIAWGADERRVEAKPNDSHKETAKTEEEMKGLSRQRSNLAVYLDIVKELSQCGRSKRVAIEPVKKQLPKSTDIKYFILSQKRQRKAKVLEDQKAKEAKEARRAEDLKRIHDMSRSSASRSRLKQTPGLNPKKKLLSRHAGSVKRLSELSAISGSESQLMHSWLEADEAYSMRTICDGHNRSKSQLVSGSGSDRDPSDLVEDRSVKLSIKPRPLDKSKKQTDSVTYAIEPASSRSPVNALPRSIGSMQDASKLAEARLDETETKEQKVQCEGASTSQVGSFQEKALGHMTTPYSQASNLPHSAVHSDCPLTCTDYPQHQSTQGIPDYCLKAHQKQIADYSMHSVHTYDLESTESTDFLKSSQADLQTERSGSDAELKASVLKVSSADDSREDCKSSRIQDLARLELRPLIPEEQSQLSGTSSNKARATCPEGGSEVLKGSVGEAFNDIYSEQSSASVLQESTQRPDYLLKSQLDVGATLSSQDGWLAALEQTSVVAQGQSVHAEARKTENKEKPYHDYSEGCVEVLKRQQMADVLWTQLLQEEVGLAWQLLQGFEAGDELGLMLQRLFQFEEINEALVTPVQIDPFSVLNRLQNEAELTLDMFLPQMLPDEIFAEMHPGPHTSLDDKVAVMNRRALYDAIGEAALVNLPGGLLCMPQPWSSRTVPLEDYPASKDPLASPLTNAVQRIKRSIESWSKTRLGKLPSEEYRLRDERIDEARLEKHRDDAIKQVLHQEVFNEDPLWTDFEMTDTQTRIDIADIIFYWMVEEVVEILVG
jgi:hypothetical protein